MTDTATEHSDIQGLVRGFDTSWPWGRFVLIELSADVDRNRSFLGGLVDVLGCAYTHGPASMKDLQDDAANMSFECAYNVAFSFLGLGKLQVSRMALETFPHDYAQGMKFRADINGDDGTSHPQWWEDHWRDRTADIWIGIYGRTEDVRDAHYADLEEYLRRPGFEGISQSGCDEAHRFLSGMLRQLMIAPVFLHFVMQVIDIDGSQFRRQHFVQCFYYIFLTFHKSPPQH